MIGRLVIAVILTIAVLWLVSSLSGCAAPIDFKEPVNVIPVKESGFTGSFRIYFNENE